MMPPFSLCLRHARAETPRRIAGTPSSRASTPFLRHLDKQDVVAGTSPAMTKWSGRCASPRCWFVSPFAIVAAVATIIAANAADAPSCVNCATEQTLPSADVVPDPPATVPSNDPAVQAHLPGCAVWTDRCVICQRDAGKISCSNIGIACQPQAVECVRAEPVEEKK